MSVQKTDLLTFSNAKLLRENDTIADIIDEINLVLDDLSKRAKWPDLYRAGLSTDQVTLASGTKSSGLPTGCRVLDHIVINDGGGFTAAEIVIITSYDSGSDDVIGDFDLLDAVDDWAAGTLDERLLIKIRAMHTAGTLISSMTAGNDGRPLKLITYEKWLKRQEDGASSGEPKSIARRGKSVFWDPVSDGAYTAKFWFWRHHPATTGTTEDILFGDEFDRLMKYGVCAEVAKSHKMTEYIDIWEPRYMAEVAKMLPEEDFVTTLVQYPD